MRELKWTPAQQCAIRRRGGSLLVGAAAGSGKTAVLVERAVSLIADPQAPVQADRLLIVTFTNAAAAELRGRIAVRLGELIAQRPGDSALRRQRVLLQRASICTIDAFCLALLQKNFAALEIPPDFATADAAQLFALRQKTLEEVLERAYQDPDFCAFADLYGRGRSDAAAGETLLALYDFLRSLPRPEKTLEEFCQTWETGDALEQTAWFGELARAARELAEAMEGLAAAALELAGKSQTGAEKYLPVLQADLADLRQLSRETRALAEGEPGLWETLRARLSGWEWGRLPAIRGGKDPETQQAADLRAAYKDMLKELQADVFLCSAAEFGQDRRRAAPLVRALARAVLDFDKSFFAAKVEERVLEFSDFEHLTLQLLQAPDGTPTAAAERIRADYDAVMVDEYQDTNALQDAIYRSLADQAGENLFLVGDLKQSIYRFRQADPAVFLAKQDDWQPITPQAAPQGEHLPPAALALDANFRSAPGVVEAVNDFFALLMSRELGGVDYGPGQALVAGAAMPELPAGPGELRRYQGFCELDVVQSSQPAGDCDFIAHRIAQMVERQVLVRDKDSVRPCRYEDFCILLRGRSGFSLYSAALENAGIPVYADVAENLLDAPQIRPFIALLQVLDNPAQDIALSAVMLSPIFGFLPDDLVHLRAETPRGSLYGALLQSARPEMQAFCSSLAQMRRLARTLAVPELLEELLARTGYLAAVGAMPGGERRREDLRRFVGWAGSAGRGGLPALMRTLDAAARTGGIQAEGGGQTRPGCVSIMTVHRSKGLEFPIVFVADTAHKFNLTDLNRPVLFHTQLGLGLSLRAQGGAGIYPTLAHRAVRRRQRLETLSEEMRILYVALTRAKDGLVLTVPLADPQKTLGDLAAGCGSGPQWAHALRSAQSWSKWLLCAAMVHPDGAPLRDASGWIITPKQGSGHIRMELVQAQSAAPAREQGNGLPTAAPEPVLLERLEQSFAWQDGRRLLRQVPAKVTVTAVVHKAEPTLLQRPAFLQKERLTGAERGTATHAFLQSADLQAAARDLPGEARRQQELGLLAPEAAAQLDWPALEGFFASPAFARLQSADRVLREYAFITSLPARAAMEDKTQDYGGAVTLVQGVADLVLVFADHAEILDYKTDRGRTAQQLVQSYGNQLRLYRYAIERRLALPVTRCSLYSLALGQEIDVPLGESSFL